MGPMFSIVRSGNNVDGSPANIAQDLSQSGLRGRESRLQQHAALGKDGL